MKRRLASKQGKSRYEPEQPKAVISVNMAYEHVAQFEQTQTSPTERKLSALAAINQRQLAPQVDNLRRGEVVFCGHGTAATKYADFK